MKYNGFLGLGVLRRQRPNKSMEPLDATAVAQLAVKLGLVTPSRMEEVRQEVNGLVDPIPQRSRRWDAAAYLTGRRPPWRCVVFVFDLGSHFLVLQPHLT